MITLHPVTAWDWIISIIYSIVVLTAVIGIPIRIYLDYKEGIPHRILMLSNILADHRAQHTTAEPPPGLILGTALYVKVAQSEQAFSYLIHSNFVSDRDEEQEFVIVYPYHDFFRNWIMIGFASSEEALQKKFRLVYKHSPYVVYRKVIA